MKILCLPALVAGTMLAAVTSANAQTTANGSMIVSATVTTNCTVSATGLEFGSLDTDNVNYAESKVTVTCNGTTALPTLNIGAGGGTVTLRKMSSGENKVPYTLSSLPDGANIASDALVVLTAITGTNTFSAALHGKITNSTDYQEGEYSDGVTLTVTYTP